MGAACSDPLPESLTIFGDAPAVPAVPVVPVAAPCRNCQREDPPPGAARVFRRQLSQRPVMAGETHTLQLL
jgi:hypothetical protein